MGSNMSESKTQWLQRVADMHGLDPEDIEEIAEMCLEDTDTHMATLKEAFNASDLKDAIRAAHSIKGSSANIGLSELCQSASAVEKQLKSANFDDYEVNLAKLFKNLEEFRVLMAQ